MRRIAIAVLLLAWLRPAFADELASTRGQALVEVSHAVELQLLDGVATYKVERKFQNRGKVADEAGLAIDLPSGATATGLRIKAKDRWHDGALMERTKAAALYKQLTGMGAYEPKDPALLQWMWADKLYLQMFPVMPGTTSTVEYTLTVPTHYSRGRYSLSYPLTDAARSSRNGGRALVAPVITVKPAWANAVIEIDGRKLAPGVPQSLAVAEQPGSADANAPRFAGSALVVPATPVTRKPIATLELDYGITHTYRGDLFVELVTPAGKHVTVREPDGGDENNLAEKVKVKLPAGTSGAGKWRLVVEDRARLDTGTLDRFTISFGSGADTTTGRAVDTPVFIPDAPEADGDAGVATIVVTAPPFTTWMARLGRVEASPTRALGMLEVDTPVPLTKLPVRAQVVFLVDASISAASSLDAQLATIRAYLAHLPDAEVEIVAYRRHAVRVFGAFVAAAQLDAKLGAAIKASAFALGNGSALDDAGRVAALALATRNGPRRIVAFTDGLLRPALPPDAAAAPFAALPPETIVHVVVPHVDNAHRVELARDDANELARVATRHHGILAHLSGIPTKHDEELRETVLELVRPTRIEKLATTDFAIGSQLREGDGIRIWSTGTTAPDRITLRGVLWSDPIDLAVVATATFSRATAAFVFGAGEHDTLTPAEQMAVALAGRAVSPVTSYVAFEPGTRPAKIGLRADESGVEGGVSGSAVGGSYAIAPPLAYLPMIQIDSRACVTKHKPPAGWHVTLAIETTRDEIVDVEVATGAGPLADCLVEAAWAYRLGSGFDELHKRHVVELPGRGR